MTEKIKIKTVFETLSEINVNNKTEKKGKLTYLSWAFCWSELKKRYPFSNYKVYETDTGRIYWDDGKTAWVKVGVTIEDLEHIEYLPIMDYKNQSIHIDKITSCDVNKTIQRAATKSIGRHGLGLYIYAGEDLPSSDDHNTPPAAKKPIDPITDIQIQLKRLTDDFKDEQSLVDIYADIGVDNFKQIKELTNDAHQIILNKLKASK